MASAPSPTVSCLMVTLPLPARLASAKRSIADYCRQTRQDSELVVVMDGGDADVSAALQHFIHALDRPDIQVHASHQDLNLGQLRNLSVSLAKADIVCQWDDDDLHHPERVEKHLAALQAGHYEAVFLRDVMQYFPQSETMFWTNWLSVEHGGHPGTLMARRDALIAYPTAGGTARLGEDAVMAQGLIARGRVGYLADHPHMFVYVSHGANSWDDTHHAMLANQLGISQSLLRRREGALRNGLAAHGFAAGRITVSGSNGPAFML